MRKIFLACLVFFLAFSIFTTKVSAHTEFQFPQVSEGQVNEALVRIVPLRLNPSNFFYFLIPVKESAERIFKPSSLAKAQFDLVLASKRLKESYLMIENNDVKKSSSSLKRYAQRLDKTIAQLEKARSQNQDTAKFTSELPDDLLVHEVLLSAIYEEWQLKEDGYKFDENFTKAIESFKNAVEAIDRIQPGVKNRFKIVKEE